MDTGLELREENMKTRLKTWTYWLALLLKIFALPLWLYTKSFYLYKLETILDESLTLWLCGSAEVRSQLGLRGVVRGTRRTHSNAVGVVGAEERTGGAVFEQRRQDQHGVPPAVCHLCNSLERWNRRELEGMQISRHYGRKKNLKAYQVLGLRALVWSFTLRDTKQTSLSQKPISSSSLFSACLLITLMLFNFMPQRYVAANEAVSVISLVSWRHFRQSGFVHWT